MKQRLVKHMTTHCLCAIWKGDFANRKQVLAAIVGGARREELWLINFLKLFHDLHRKALGNCLLRWSHGYTLGNPNLEHAR